MNELNLRDYFRVINKRKWVIVFTLACFLFVTFLYLKQQAPVYQAICTVRLVERGVTSSQTFRDFPGFMHGLLAAGGVQLQSEANIITSYAILEKVAKKLNLINDKMAQDEKDAEINMLRGSLKTKLLEQTTIIEITATSKDARQAMLLANTTAEVYQEHNLLERNEEARKTREFIEDQLSKIEQSLSKAEGKLKDFQASGEGTTLDIARPLEDKLVDLEFERAKLLQKYTEEHPKVIELTGQIAQMEKQLIGFSDKALEFTRIKREVEVNHKLYAMLKEKFEEARIAEAAKIGNVAIVNPASLPRVPFSATQQLAIIIGTSLGLLLGLTLAFLLEGMDTSIGTIEELERILKLPVLTVVPRIALEKRRKFTLKSLFANKGASQDEEIKIRLMVHYDPKSSEAEAYKALRTNLKIGPGHKVFILTSSGPAEGKTTILVNLGIAAAQAGLKTLLVSTDLRKPAIEKTFGIEKEPGFYEIVTKAIAWDKALRGISDIMMGSIGLNGALKTGGLDNLYIITAGHSIPNPSEILSSENIKPFVEELKNNFDVVLFDSPPVLPISDALLLSTFCDGTIIIYEMGRTSREALLRAKSQIEGYGAKIAGIVMNQTKPQMEMYPAYPYYYSKYKYYSEEKKSKAEPTR